MGFNNLPIFETILVYESNSVAMKNGRSDGTTLFAHKINPDFAADRLFLEKTTKNTIKIQNEKGIMFFFKDKNINFGLEQIAFIKYLTYNIYIFVR